MIETAKMLASIFGPVMLILGVWMLFYHENMMKVCNAIKTNPGMIYLMGILNLLIAFVVLNGYNVWIADLSFLMTIFGWFMLIRGLMALFVPHVWIKWAHDPSWMKVKGIVPLIWGFGLCWLAFWMQ